MPTRSPVHTILGTCQKNVTTSCSPSVSVSLRQTDLYSLTRIRASSAHPLYGGNWWIGWYEQAATNRCVWGHVSKIGAPHRSLPKTIPVNHGLPAESRELSRTASRDTRHLRLSACSTAALIFHPQCRKSTSAIRQLHMPRLPMPGSPSASWAVYRARLKAVFEGAEPRVCAAFWLFG